MKILCFARTRRQTAAKLDAVSEQIWLHLLKIFMYPQSEAQARWKHELWALLFRVDKLKGSNKFPSAAFILAHTWDEIEDSFYSVIPLIEEDMGISQAIDPFKGALYDAVRDYFLWLAQALSSRGLISASECNEKVEALRTKYFSR